MINRGEINSIQARHSPPPPQPTPNPAPPPHRGGISGRRAGRPAPLWVVHRDAEDENRAAAAVHRRTHSAVGSL